MKLKKVIFISILFLISSSLVSCKDDLMSCEKIEKQLFNDVAEIAVSSNNSLGYRELNVAEIKVLRNSIRNGKELSDIPQNDMPMPFKKIVFFIKYKDHSGSSIIYDNESGYMFIYKYSVNKGKFDEAKKNPDVGSKFLEGVYKFKPLETDIREIVSVQS